MLKILYQDKNLAIISKPPGLLVHRTEIDFHETENAVKQLNRQLGKHVYPTHRLDKPTSGVLVFALDKDSARAVNLAFDNRQVEKMYIGVVRGYTEASGVIDYPLSKMDSSPGPEIAQDAITRYKRLAIAELPNAVGRYPSARYSLVMLTPITGRRHQLRRHMKHIFHPLIGDTTYGDGKHNQFFRKQFSCQRLLLHCSSMTLPHPVSGNALSIIDPLNEEFEALLAQLGWDNPQFLIEKNISENVKIELISKKI